MARQMCQSCSMPLYDKVLGTEKDGSPSQKYCRLCYQDGAFTTPNMSMREMQDIVVQVLNKEKHWPRPIARLASRQIPRLERWQ